MSIARLVGVRTGNLTGALPNQESMVSCFRFLRYCAAQGLCTIIASNIGLAGTGEQFHDEANPLGENAFIVARFDQGTGVPWYVLLQWADISVFGASPGNPGLISNSTGDGIGIQMAIRQDGGNPWAGTVGDTGTNTKGTPVWVPGGSTVHVWPRSNNAGGAHSANKENCARATRDVASGFARYHFGATENGIMFLQDSANAGLYGAVYVGRVEPLPGITVPTFPYAMIAPGNNTGFWGSGSGAIYGSTTGAGSREGGILGNPANGVDLLTLGIFPTAQEDAAHQPNSMRGVVAFEGGRIFAFQTGVSSGLVGALPQEICAEVFNTNNNEFNAAGDKAYMASTTIAAQKHVISWDGGLQPGNSTTRLGRLSFTA